MPPFPQPQTSTTDPSSSSGTAVSLPASGVIALSICIAIIATLVGSAIYKLYVDKSTTASTIGNPVYDNANLHVSERERLREVRRRYAAELEETGRLARLEAGERLSNTPAAWLPRLRRLTTTQTYKTDIDPLFFLPAPPPPFHPPPQPHASPTHPHPSHLINSSNHPHSHSTGSPTKSFPAHLTHRAPLFPRAPPHPNPIPPRNRNRFSRFSFPFPVLRDSMRASRGDDLDYTAYEDLAEGHVNVAAAAARDDGGGEDVPPFAPAPFAAHTQTPRGHAFRLRFARNWRGARVKASVDAGHGYGCGNGGGPDQHTTDDQGFIKQPLTAEGGFTGAGLPPRSIYSVQASRGPMGMTGMTGADAGMGVAL